MSFLSQLFNALFGSDGYSELLPGSSFHAITAAFATQGYWIHADMLNYVGAGEFQRFAVLIYMFALISGIVSMAMGAPPKQYLWFFMGPALFHFLLGTTSPVMGTAWKVAGVPQEQKEVWKLAEVGLKGMNITQREGLEVNGFGPPSGGVNGDGTVNISFAFATLDGAVSDTIQTIISWLGVYEVGGDANSSTTGAVPTGSGSSSTKVSTAGRWHLLSNLKWGMLDTITQARLASPEVRDAFINFMASDCGDAFQQSIDTSNYSIASKSQSGVIPAGIFKSSKLTPDAYAIGLEDTYANLNTNLSGVTVPFPLSLRRLLNPPLSAATSAGGNTAAAADVGSFRKAISTRGQVPYGWENWKSPNNDVKTLASVDDLLTSGNLQCSIYLDILVRGFRWEAAGVYAQLADQMPAQVKDDRILNYAMFFGWDIRKFAAKDLFPTDTSKTWQERLQQDDGNPNGLTDEGKKQYMLNLIMINMMKNEFLMAPNAAARKLRFTSAQQAQSAIEMYQKTIGSRNKFGEIYSWAMMMPYLQGVLLYLLALGYPFACAVMLLPKCSKILFTWSSFWIWAKLWDLGFAVVTLLERSVWATIGNSAKATQVNPFIAQMMDFGSTSVHLNNGQLPTVAFGPGADVGLVRNNVFSSYAFLDRAMTLFSNMDLDLQNSYYIYIMAALYFAVPMITGQLVLGAKASLAGAVTGAFSDMAKEVGGKAGSAYGAAIQGQMARSQQVMNKAFAIKALSTSGIADQVLGAQNAATASTMRSDAMQAEIGGLRNRQAMVDAGFKIAGNNLKLESDLNQLRLNPQSFGTYIGTMMKMGGTPNLTKSDLASLPAAQAQLLENANIWNKDGVIDAAKFKQWSAPGGAIKNFEQAGAGDGSGTVAGGGRPGISGNGAVKASPRDAMNAGAGFQHAASGGGNSPMGSNGGFGGGNAPMGVGGNILGFDTKTMGSNLLSQMGRVLGSEVDITSKYGQHYFDSMSTNSSVLNTAVMGGMEIDSAQNRSYSGLLNQSAQRGGSLANGTANDAYIDGQFDMFMQASNSGMLAISQVSTTGAFNTELTYLAGSGRSEIRQEDGSYKEVGGQLGTRAFDDFKATEWHGDGSAKNGGLFQQQAGYFGQIGDAFGTDKLLSTHYGVTKDFTIGGAYDGAQNIYKQYYAGAQGSGQLPGDQLMTNLQYASTVHGVGAPLGAPLMDPKTNAPVMVNNKPVIDFKQNQLPPQVKGKGGVGYYKSVTK